jgi:hypothetical protein
MHSSERSKVLSGNGSFGAVDKGGEISKFRVSLVIGFTSLKSIEKGDPIGSPF